jgi:hypothetical protein
MKKARCPWPIAKGSLAEVKKPCIRSNCRACKEGSKHSAYIFSFSRGGRRRCLYVPRGLVATLQRAISNGREFEKKMFEFGVELIMENRRKHR